MDTIGIQDLWSFEDDSTEATCTNCRNIRKFRGNVVSDYPALAAKIAELQFRNRDYVLMFRGQKSDHMNQNGLSTLQPSIFRATGDGKYHETVKEKFRILNEVEGIMESEYLNSLHIGSDEISRFRLIRWSIIQHYEICDTPLLDVTQSLRIAASFATNNNDTDESFLYVLGVPQISGAITVNAESGVQTIRLSSVCPPSAMRPHIQEGFLLGNYPDIDIYRQKEEYGLSEMDFGKRLVAKFKINPETFWAPGGQFQKIGPRALYPASKDDPIYQIAKSIKKKIGEASS